MSRTVSKNYWHSLTLDERISQSRKFDKIQLKNRELDTNEYKNLLHHYSYQNPNFCQLCLSSGTNNYEKKSTENATFTTSWAESSFYISENEEAFLGPQMLINDEWLLAKSGFNEIISSQEHCKNMNICFPATYLNKEEIQNIHLVNKGTCTIQYSWKVNELHDLIFKE